MEWQHKSSIRSAAYATSPTTKILGEPSYDLFNLFSSYNFGNFSVRFGIENLLDKQPPVVGANPGVDSNTDATAPGLYDILGRRFYVGMSARF